MPDPTKPRPDYVQSLERGLAVIKAFDGEHPRLTLSDVARRKNLTRAAARRFLLTLVELGYVHSDGKEFSLRPSVLDLGAAYLGSMGLADVALPHMETLVAAVQESSSMSVLDGRDVIYVARVPTRQRIMTVSIAVGTRFPAYATSMGRVLLAHVPAVTLDEYLASAELTQHTDNTIRRCARRRGHRRRGPAPRTRASASSVAFAANPCHPARRRVGHGGECSGGVSTDIVLIASSDIAELHEVAAGAGGSSSMAHKRNPVAAVSARAAAAQAPGLVATVLHAAGGHELQRAAGAWHAEWPAMQSLLRCTGAAVEWLAASVERLVVDPDRMASNLDAANIPQKARRP